MWRFCRGLVRPHYWAHRNLEHVFEQFTSWTLFAMELILDKLLTDRVFVQQKVFVWMASEHRICSIIAKCYDKVDVLRLIYTYNVNCINENWRFVINFLICILTTAVSSQHKIPVFDPLSGSWHACFSIFMIIFGYAAISNIFQIWLSGFNRI